MTATKPSQLACLCLLAILISGSACTQQSPARPAKHAASQGPDSTVDRVCKITAESLGLNLSSVTPSTSLDELGADKLDFVELVMEIEDQFDITISDDAITGITGNDIFQGNLRKVTMKELARIVDDHR